MPKGIASSRRIIAGKQRITPYSTARLIANTDLGAGLQNHAVARVTDIDIALTASVITCTHASGFTYYQVRSEKFPGQYYLLRPLANGGWHFSGEERLAAKYIAKVEAMLAECEQERVAAEKYAAFLLVSQQVHEIESRSYAA